MVRKALPKYVSAACMAALPFAASAQTTIDPAKSLLITDEQILNEFTFSDVIENMLVQGSGQTSVQFALDWLTLRSAQPNKNLETAKINADNNLDQYIPIALINRFDLAAADGSHCGEYRIAFNTQEPSVNQDPAFIQNEDNKNETFVIFEAQLANPFFNTLGAEGCQEIYEFWADLSNDNDINSRAIALRDFYFDGLPGFGPIFDANNYAENTGQIRLNVNDLDGAGWIFSEWKTSINGQSLEISRSTVKNTPSGFLASQNAANNTNANLFQNTVLNAIGTAGQSLLANTMTDLAITFDNSLNRQTQATLRSSTASQMAGNIDSDFFNNLLNTLNAPGSDPSLTPEQVLARTHTNSCQGCHNTHSNDFNLGGALASFDTSNQDIEFLSAVSQNGQFLVKPSMQNVFLPERKARLEALVNTQAVESLFLEAENFRAMNGIGLENTSDVGGGLNVGWTDAGDWMDYDVVIPPSASGLYEVSYRVASNVGGSSLRFEQAGGAVVFDTVNVPHTGGWQNWQTITHTVSLPHDGQQLIAIATSAGGWNLNWFEVKPIDSCDPCGGNMISNGDFSQGGNGWSTYIDNASNGQITLGDAFGNANVSMQNGGTEAWHVQFYQTGLNIQQGLTYRLSFDATTSSKSSSGQFQVVIEEDGNDYTPYMQAMTVFANPSAQSFSFTFTMPELTDANARVTFNMGDFFVPPNGPGKNISIDNVQLVQIAN